MRGAVLHKMGLNYVKERVMRRHYGVLYSRPGFRDGKDPEHFRSVNIAGEEVCDNVMQWYAFKVSRP